MNISDLPAGTLRTAVLKLLAEEVKNAVDGDKGDLMDVMTALGIKSLSATLADGTEVATITKAGGKASPKVTDPKAFLAWVVQNRTEETETVVRDSYRKALLAEMEKTGQPVDPETGEAVPGVEFKAGSEYLTVSYTNGSVQGRERIKEAWRNGQISLPELLALPAGDEPDAA